MDVQVEDLSPVEKKIQVEVPWDDVRQKLDKAYKQLSRGVQLRGFRKGKVPRSVLEKMFGEQVRGEVMKDLVTESFYTAAQEHHIHPVAEPVLQDGEIKRGEPLRYSVTVEVRPEVQLKETSGFTLSKRKLLVNDEEVDVALEQKRMDHTEFVTIVGRDKLTKSDVVEIVATGTVGDQAFDRPELMVDLGQAESEPLPGLHNAIIGLSLTASDHELTWTLPNDLDQKELAGQQVRLSVTVKQAREKRVPDLDDEFAKDTGEVDTLAELRKNLRETLEKQAKSHIEREVRDQALKVLIQKNPVPLSPALIERGVDSQLERLMTQFGMQGIDLSQGDTDTEKMREGLREPAETEIRGQLLLEALADQEKLEVSDEELDKRVAEVAAIRRKPAQKMKAEMDRDGSLDSLKWRLRQDKALDLIVSRATIGEATPKTKSAKEK